KEDLSFCWDQLQDGNVLLTVLQNRPDLLILAGIYCAFRPNGMRNTRLENEIAVVSRLGGVEALGHRLIICIQKSHPNSDGCEFDQSEVVGVMFLVASGHGSE